MGVSPEQRGCCLRFALLDISKEEIPLQPNQSLIKWHSPPKEEFFCPKYQVHVVHAMSLISQGGYFRFPKYVTQGPDPMIFPGMPYHQKKYEE